VKDSLARARRTAAGAGGVTLLLAATKGAVGAVVGSTVLLADALHSTVDLLALLASWFGLKLASKKPTERFPYGFYRAETLSALVASGVILVLGMGFFLEGIERLSSPLALSHPTVAMTVAVVSAVVAICVSTWERRVGRATGSQSLIATADEARLDVGSSFLVFVALLATRYRVPYIEGIVTIVISSVVIAVGLRNASRALLALMDASVDRELETETVTIIENIPGVRTVEKLRARRSGPFYFVEGHVQVAPSMDVTRSHMLSHEAQRRLQEQRPDVEGVVLHIEPYHSNRRRILVPITTPEGLQSPVEFHFGRARWFLLATLEGNRIVDTSVEENPFTRREVRAGVAVINTFVKEKELDGVLVREIGEIAYHGLGDNCVEVFRAPQGTAEESITAYAEGRLDFLPAPTHSSDDKLEDGTADGDLKKAVEERLGRLIAAETGLDVMRMGLVRELHVKDGAVELVFQPSSSVCPMAFKLAADMRKAIAELDGVESVHLKVQNFTRARELEELINQSNEKSETTEG